MNNQNERRNKMADTYYKPVMILSYTETLMQISEDGTRYEIGSPDPQYIVYTDEDLLDEHLELEWSKDVYDGEFDNDYDNYRFVAQTDLFDEDDEDCYIGFQRIFRTEDGKEVIYEVKKSTGIMVGSEN